MLKSVCDLKKVANIYLHETRQNNFLEPRDVYALPNYEYLTFITINQYHIRYIYIIV